MPRYKQASKASFLPGGDRGNIDTVSYNPPQDRTRTPMPVTAPSQAQPLPVAYGTVKASAYLIEGQPPRKISIPLWAAGAVVAGAIVASDGSAWKCLKGGTATGGNNPQGGGAFPLFWVPSTAYATLGDVLQNASALGNTQYVYQLTQTGTSAGSGGPNTTGPDIIDNTCHWQWIGETSNSLGDGTQGNFYINHTPDGLIWQWLSALPYEQWYITMLCAVCEGQAQGALKLWWDQERYATVSSTDLGKMLKLYLGPDALGQAPTGNFDSAGYQNTVLIGPNTAAGRNLPIGTMTEIPAIAVELQSVMFGVATNDVNPADILNDMLTHTRRGCGWSSSLINAATVTGGGAGTYRTYTDAAGFRMSMYIDSQRMAIDIFADLLNASNSDGYWSEGVLKVVPLGDQPIAAPVFGATAYVPPNVAQYNLSEVDFQDTLKVVRRDDTECFNTIPVEYIDRLEMYTSKIVEDPDQTDIDKRGMKWIGGTLSLPVIFRDGTPAIQLSRILTQRSLRIRNTYTFSIPWKYLLLEPTDIVTLSDKILGFNLRPVRILNLREEGFRWVVTAEDYPAGVAASNNPYQPQVGDGYQPNNFGTAAGGIPVAFGTGALTTPMGDNAWPNPTSEINPPTNTPVGNDGSSPEWDYRFNAGGGAHNGSWVRKLIGGVSLTKVIPTVQDEIVQLFAWANGQGLSGVDMDLRLIFYNAAGGVVSTVPLPGWAKQLASPYIGAGPVATGSWGWNMVTWRTPAAAVKVAAVLNGISAQVNYYDDIVFRRLPAAAPPGGYKEENGGAASAIECTAYDTYTSVMNIAGVGSILAPSNPYVGQTLDITLKNTSVAAAPTWAFNGVFHLSAAVANPVATKNRSYRFRFDGSAWIELYRGALDVPN